MNPVRDRPYRLSLEGAEKANPVGHKSAINRQNDLLRAVRRRRSKAVWLPSAFQAHARLVAAEWFLFALLIR